LFNSINGVGKGNEIMPNIGLMMLLFGMSIAAALFTDSQSRLYRWLFGQPERAYHLNELRRLTSLGSASLQRELNRLAAAGLVDAQAVGNLRRFQANTQSPVYAELVALTRKTLGTVPVLRDTLQPLQPNLKSAWVYGSVAKQTDTARSDIDVMLVGNDLPLSRVLAVLEPAEAQLGRKINPSCYTPEEFARRRGEPDSFVNRVLSQATLPLIGEAHEPA
jgi:predicted nucleotidyltransferase